MKQVLVKSERSSQFLKIRPERMDALDHVGFGVIQREEKTLISGRRSRHRQIKSQQRFALPRPCGQ
jgi:hypothetical protein